MKFVDIKADPLSKERSIKLSVFTFGKALRGLFQSRLSGRVGMRLIYRHLIFFFFFKNYQHPKRSVFREPPFKGKKLVFFHPHPPINFWEDTDLYKKSFAQAQGTQRNLQPISIVMYIHFQIHRGVMWNLSVHNNKT